ncbi:hypothetical protein J7E81_29675 [Bacillus sp. ISL-18]|uniref:hypothetical protein n=1 Tax=Bacillus sp. ISL-18 TaxID=2819118 RepID=UPI001BEBB5F9|nr:hypothetical protein [Bacillus sp. ISL-18]MBT2659303.1 hypothetical protein [Bacillus sp. ISL-18]
MARAIDIALYLVPATKAFRATTAGFKLLSYTTQKSMVRAIAGAVAKTSFHYIKISESKIFNILNLAAGGIGSIVTTYLIDPLDGKRDGKVMLW